MKTINATDLNELLGSPEGSWPVRKWALFDVREVGESQKGHISTAPGRSENGRYSMSAKLARAKRAISQPRHSYPGA